MIDLTGKSFGRLTAQWPAGRRIRRQVYWLCLCECGTLRIVRRGHLMKKGPRSCGCLKREESTLRLAEFNKRTGDAHKIKRGDRLRLKHGHASGGKTSPEYRTWTCMLTRCTNSKTRSFRNYGGKGIMVCERWKSFENFLADMGPRPKGTTLGRFADIGNYQPGNCAWMTWEQQMAERRKKRLAA